MSHSHTHNHDHAHEHGHTGACSHHPAPSNFDGVFRLAIGLNLGFVVTEFVAGFWANSTALLADAGHNFSDVLGLLVAWFAFVLARKKASQRFSFGLRSSSILAALLNAMLLMLACGGIVWEAIHRLQQPVVVASQTVMLVAAVGIVINGFSAWLFMRNQQHDLNLRGAYLHMLADALVSFGVVLAGGLMAWTQWNWLDPAITLIIVVVIFWGTWGLFRESLALSLHAVPAHINLPEVISYIKANQHIGQLNDLHIWALSTSETALSAELVLLNEVDGPATIRQLTKEIKTRFKIHHVTLQVSDQFSQPGCQLDDTH